jgi:hypothetical protein
MLSRKRLLKESPSYVIVEVATCLPWRLVASRILGSGSSISWFWSRAASLIRSGLGASRPARSPPHLARGDRLAAQVADGDGSRSGAKRL